jgi:hypothetical protein
VSVERLAGAAIRERIDVLLALSSDQYWSLEEVRTRAGLDTVHPNVALGHLRRLREVGLVSHSSRLGWTQAWPAGFAAAELIRAAEAED